MIGHDGKYSRIQKDEKVNSFFLLAIIKIRDKFYRGQEKIKSENIYKFHKQDLVYLLGRFHLAGRHVLTPAVSQRS